MKRGDYKKIAKETKLHPQTISKFLKDEISISQNNEDKIISAMKKLNIIPFPLEYIRNKKINLKPHILIKIPKNRYDIYNNLPRNGVSQIAQKCGCSRTQVYRVLQGNAKDDYGIIKEGELIAAINIWKLRFCKYPSEL